MTEGRRGARMRRVSIVAALTVGLACLAPAATADDYDSGGFEGFPLGDPIGQNGWTALDVGAYNAANFDIEVVDPSTVWGSALGSRALRMSNAIISGGFGNQLQSPSLADEAGETGATASVNAGGTRQSRISGTIEFASATQSYQPDLYIRFAPDPGDGVRMANFRIMDEPGGLRVDLQVIDESDSNLFVYRPIATGLSYTEVHTLQFSLDFVDGENNDVMWAQVDGVGCETFDASGSWEQYHRVYAGNVPPKTFTADSLQFRLSTIAAPALSGAGLLFNTVDLSTSTAPPMPGPGVPTVTSAPTATSVGQHVDVTSAPAETNGCEPVIDYTATLTPEGGGSPIRLTSTTPDFDFEAVPAGTYAATVTATNASGASESSAPTSVTVTVVAEPEPSVTPSPTLTPDPDPSPSDGDGGELAESGPTLLPLGIASAALVVLGFALRRRAI